ncbi:Rad52/Rad22 family DNA repair protein [Erythrobacter aureus]|uniref:Uncharacterized protein n=1 Tax=Erythrobacter aureus TaxID=2182384 RepID=A0A345YIL8_9SPHN|nr:Rad52/Rad22 family DNA repair protein [Erythrobacter aureus]AXK43770.1 hypothetical protein DVR09_15045 [Erythrobacter aureus]
MQTAPGNAESVDYGNELASPFFTRGQLLAFRHPPSTEAVEQVRKGGNHDYIPHEYIRAVLDRYIGTGRWDFSATLHSVDKEIIRKTERDKEPVEMLALTVNVNIELRIHARDGSSRMLVYSAIGSCTHNAGVDKGYGSIMANAIGSAESLGLKRAASNLGKAFGFDLKSKVKKEDLPPPLEYFNQKINEHYSAKYGTPLHTGNQLEASSETLRLADNSSDKDDEGAQTNVRSIRQPTKASEAEPAADAEQPAEWDLKKVPEDYLGWLSCLQTLIAKLPELGNERELKSFVRRNQKIIKKLPVLPAEDGHPERDFEKRWQTELGNRYDQLGIKRPADLKKAA